MAERSELIVTRDSEQDTNQWTDLGSYYRKGGKIIFYHGASDPWYSMLHTLDGQESISSGARPLREQRQIMKRDYNFREGKRGAILKPPTGKTRITIRINEDILQTTRPMAGIIKRRPTAS